MFRKGQAAMEFLMTYGWAILAAIIVIAVLVWILNPGAVTPESCSLNPPLTCSDQEISEARGITIEIENGAGEDITVTAVNIGADVSNPDCSALGATNITDGAKDQFTATGCGITEGSNYRADIQVTYTKGTGTLVHTASGKISGPVGA